MVSSRLFVVVTGAGDQALRKSAMWKYLGQGAALCSHPYVGLINIITDELFQAVNMV